MLIDEELIKKNFGKLLMNGTPRFYKLGVPVENVKCKRILLLNLSKGEVDNDVTSYNVTGKVSLEELCDFGTTESTKSIESKIQVKGDDILDDQNIRVGLKG